ncbi:hypothetical protein HDV06_000380 [Boothiomyces sp. JEL0866]|nr:hypothetical protein HDV06_000380 [Boothiomyces sp. JEL0866]
MLEYIQSTLFFRNAENTKEKELPSGHVYFGMINHDHLVGAKAEKSIQKKHRELEKLKGELELLQETRRNLRKQLEETQREETAQNDNETQQETQQEDSTLESNDIQDMDEEPFSPQQEIHIENDTDTDVDIASNNDSFESETKTLGDNTITELRQKISEYKYMSQELGQLEQENVEIVDLLEQSSKRKLELLFELSIRKKEIKT